MAELKLFRILVVRPECCVQANQRMRVEMVMKGRGCDSSLQTNGGDFKVLKSFHVLQMIKI